MATLPTSGTYNFQSIEVELLIREAFENIGIFGEFVESQKLDSARRSINFLLLEWMSKSVNLWTLEYTYLPLTTSQAKYILPNEWSDVIQINLRTSTRQLNGIPDATGFDPEFAFDGNPLTHCNAEEDGWISYDYGIASYNRLLNGTAASSSGVAANAFDGNPATSCTQNAPNGWISYDYGVGITQKINFVGIQSNATLNYTLELEYSLDNVTWNTLYVLPTPFTYSAGLNFWFYIPNPISARAYRIREVGGATLNIRELYFNNNIQNTQQINFVGICPFIDLTIDASQAAIFISQDGNVWTGLQRVPAGTYLAGQTYWFDIIAPEQAQYYKIQVQGGVTLDLIELYFNNNLYDMPISEVSRYEYFTYPNKQLQSRPSVYYIDRQIDPFLYIWPVPSPNYNCLQISYKRMIQDAGAYANNTLDIPSRFYPPLVLGLSWKLAVKFKPEAAAQFKAEYEQAFNIATIEDSENVAISIRGDTTYDYWR